MNIFKNIHLFCTELKLKQIKEENNIFILLFYDIICKNEDLFEKSIIK